MSSAAYDGLATSGAGQGSLELTLLTAAHPLVHLNAALNSLATILLLAGLWQIRRRRETAHGRTMMAALAVSTVFLVSYLAYHYLAGSVRFTHPGPVKYIYLAILLSHIVLAVTVPFLAITAAWLGAKALGWGGFALLAPEEKARFRVKHLRLVRWAFPIWLYVSVTGVVVYAMLYHLWPSTDI